MTIYILLPIFNEEKNIRPLFSRIKQGMERHGLTYQIISYNDGSNDGSLRVLREITVEYPLTIIGKEVNMGLGYGLMMLFDEVLSKPVNDNDIAVILDSDNTHNPEHIYQMVNKIADGFDVVIASRYLKDSRIVGVSAWRQMLSSFASIFMRIIFPIPGVKDYTCGYRAYRVDVIRRAKKEFGDKLIEETGFACMAEFLIKLKKIGILAVEIPLVLRYDFKLGESKMQVMRTIKRTLLMILRLRRV